MTQMNLPTKQTETQRTDCGCRCGPRSVPLPPRSVPLPPESPRVAGVSAAAGRPQSSCRLTWGLAGEEARGHTTPPSPEPPREALPCHLPRDRPIRGGVEGAHPEGPRGLLGGGCGGQQSERNAQTCGGYGGSSGRKWSGPAA